MTRHEQAHAAVAPERWYVPLMIAAGAMVALLAASVAALQVFTARVEVETAPPSWHASLARMDDAIARGHVAAAAARWQDAYARAQRSGQWQALLQAGDGSRRLGRAAGAAGAGDRLARHAYLDALLRARRAESVEGVLRAAEAFAELGDRDVVQQCLRVAVALAARATEPVAMEQVKRFSDRWAARTLEAERGRTTR